MESNRWSLFDYLHVGVSGFPPDGLVSIDVTYRCNLHCLQGIKRRNRDEIR
jgi:hypothetical protein